MDQPDESWQDEVRDKLVEVFEERPEDLCRIFHFLDEEDKAYKDSVSRPYAPQWISLKATMKKNEAFKTFANMLAEDTKKAEKDQEFRKRMNIVYEQMMSYREDEVNIEETHKLDIARLCDYKAPSTSAFGGLARAWNKIPVESRTRVISCIKAVARDPKWMNAVDDVVSLVNKCGGTVAMIGLAAVYLSYEAYVNIQRWWKGEISGKRCIKNLLDQSFTAGAGFGGGMAGASYGMLAAGPLGAVAGGMIGGYISAAVANCLSDYLTQWLFGLPKDVALENAYRHLGVKMTASNAEVNTAFRKLCLKTHPDKPGGTTEKFIKLQWNMATIRQARGEF